MHEFKPFEVNTVELAGSNLIEASAGTGKTYSVAILVLRLIIEKEINVKEIVMVTFTRAAVAELEERIRLFIRLAYKASLGEMITDETIANIVRVNLPGGQVQKLLRNAVLYLDEISVLTIHSFCQQTLTEFAFETDQLFGAETLQDKKAVLADEINKFWRAQVTTIPAELLKYLIDSDLSRNSIQRVVNEHLGGKKYYEYEKGKSYGYCLEDHEKIIAELKEIKERQESLVKEMQHYVEANDSKLRIVIGKNHHAKKLFDNIDQPKKIVGIIRKKHADTGYIKSIFAEILTHCETCDKLATELSARIRQVISDINCQAINAAETGLKEYMQRNNLLTFDDLITNLHRAVADRENPRLVSALRKKYKAVFVDEFQDTDRWQYEIFHSIFGRGTILFYIGDPKQSIYSFRKADIHTYFKAGAEVAHRFTMDTNFRSGEKFIEAMNLFFEPVENFDTFAFGDAEEGIKYRKVHSPVVNKKGQLRKGGTPVVAITITDARSKEELYDAVIAQIIELLSNPDYTIGERRVKPGDIGILVRVGKDGRFLKRALSRHGIPAVNIDEQKILKSEDSQWLLYLLEAMIDITHENINKALLSPFTGFGKEDIRKINLESAVGLFRVYRDTWNKDGVYAAMMKFISDFNVRQVLLEKNTGIGERVIANLYQLIELIHKIQNNKDFSPLELVSWLQRGMEGMEMTGDEFEQRVESDEDAIKIVTIHKSKGLEYNIVFAPFLDMVFYKDADIFSYRDPESGEYISIEKESTQEKELLIKEQAEQENRRLVYVAITRAVYKCYLFHSTHYSSNDSSLNAFLKVMDYSRPELIAKTAALEVPAMPRVRAGLDSAGAASSPEIPNTRHVVATLASDLVAEGADASPENPNTRLVVAGLASAQVAEGAGSSPEIPNTRPVVAGLAPILVAEGAGSSPEIPNTRPVVAGSSPEIPNTRHVVAGSSPEIPNTRLVGATLAVAFLAEGADSSAPKVTFTLRERNWTKMSYTMLARKGEIISRLPAGKQNNDYDDFILKQLTRGSKTGNLLHEIFENISFSHEPSWEKVITEALAKHLPARKESFAPFLLDMLRQTIYLPIKINGRTFTLSEVNPASKINEFEFDFLVDQYNPAELNKLSDETIDVRVGWDTPLQGILNGKMDLFFAHDGRYYILDWKSNYLGDTLADYSQESLAIAMSENNYHLQYLIYALAAKKYLSVRLNDFNYERDFGGIIYLFIRGVRTGSDTGIFTASPSFGKITMLEEIVRSPIRQL